MSMQTRAFHLRSSGGKTLNPLKRQHWLPGVTGGMRRESRYHVKGVEDDCRELSFTASLRFNQRESHSPSSRYVLK